MLSYKIVYSIEDKHSFFELLEKVIKDTQFFITRYRDRENIALITEYEIINKFSRKSIFFKLLS